MLRNINRARLQKALSWDRVIEFHDSNFTFLSHNFERVINNAWIDERKAENLMTGAVWGSTIEYIGTSLPLANGGLENLGKKKGVWKDLERGIE